MGLPIAIDAMGGDNAPDEIVRGAVEAAEAGFEVLLVGREEALPPGHGLPVVHASEVIEMDDDPAAGVRRKKDSSLVRSAELVRDGKASAMVSAGNTGATMASALLRMGRIKGVSRPAIATVLPIPGAGPTLLLDAGANAECQPEWLVQFAQMGSAFAQHHFGLPHPRVGLLSIGEEHMKGSSFVKETHALLATTGGIHFIGNVEGRDVPTDEVDVVVTDGFTGNVTLKTLEGAVTLISERVRAIIDHHPDVAERLAPELEPFYRSIDWQTHGGAVLLGVEGVCIISHGSSSARAVVNAVRVAAEMVDAEVVASLRAAVA